MSQHTEGPHTPRTMSAQIEAAIRQYPRIYGVDTREALLREIDAERAVSAELLEALKNVRALLAHQLETDTVHVGDSDQSGHPHGWCAVRIPDWLVKQAIEWMDQDIAKANLLAKAEPSPSDSQGAHAD